jgi:prepilin-type N-terminal cleavage/methylation domain-containing protein
MHRRIKPVDYISFIASYLELNKCRSFGHLIATSKTEMHTHTSTRTHAAARHKDGFSLIELLIVVAIILIIAAIAIPSLLRSRIAANEAAAASAVRTLTSAQYTYNAAYPTIGFATDLASLGGANTPCTPTSTAACIIDPSLASGKKGGYNFFAGAFAPSGGLNTTFVSSSAPSNYGITGVRKFCMVADGSLHIHPGNDTTPAPDVSTCISYPIAQ